MTSLPDKVVRIAHLAGERAMSGHDQIAATLGMEILRGVHRPGTNMPSEPELIARFQVSRTVMREVMKTLAAKGFVVSRTRVGTRVLDPVNWNYFDADVLAWRVRLGLDDEFRSSLTEIRRAIEPAAAALAAQRRTSADLVTLRRHVAAMNREGHTRLSFAQADLEFHLAIGAASGNPLMRSIASVIEAALVASFSQSSPVDDPGGLANTVRSHEAIVDAIEARDERAAANAMLKVIDIGVQRIQAAKKGRRNVKR
jgi:DNA-binding FadR family transcriptional regulator